jgi:HSP20 family protein
MGREMREWDPVRRMRELLDWDPFAQMAPYGGEQLAAFQPSFEIKETRDSYVFKADMPGVAEKDIDISLTGNRLTISGRRECEDRNEDERYFAYECSYGSFVRSFTLPDGVDGEHVNAELKDGVLTLVIPKRPETQPRKIAVKGGSLGGEKTKAKA